MKEYKVDSKKVENFLTEVNKSTGMLEEDARVSAELMVKTNLWGIDSHGLLRAGVYYDRLDKKIINPNAKLKTIKDLDGPVAILDGDAGLGYVVGKESVSIAIEKAKKFGISFVLVNNSNHFGAASLYTQMAVEAGLIGMTTTNVVPNIGMKGQVKPSTGNNPIALGFPMKDSFPFSLDISMSAVSGGKLLLAAKNGQKIPTSWALTKEGDETDDPNLGFAGFLLPMGMHKGWGMSLFIDVITGLLANGPYMNNLKSMYKNPNDTSLSTHLFCCIDPTFFMSQEDYDEKIKDWEKMVHATPMKEEGARQIIPGEMEYKKEQERLKNGIPISEELYKDLEEIGKRCNVSFDILK